MSLSTLKVFFTGTKKCKDGQAPATTRLIDQIFEDAEKMVGKQKSNKFDYTRRSSGGVKLGTSICEAFRKEVPKARKDAIRQAAQLLKRSTGSGVSDNTRKEIGVDVIDLKVPNKHLGDEGVRAMVPGILEALTAQTGDVIICLEDVNLSGNNLTVESLAMLGPVIRESVHDLKTLNLANNDIRVITDLDAADFETFLMSFKYCFKLRRLDLSGNKELGHKALEVLSRVFFSEKIIAPLSMTGEGSVVSFDGEDIDSDDGSKLAKYSDIPSPLPDQMTHAVILARRCGLRSLPYINLSDVGLDDIGAVWLATILPHHYYPIQLVNPLNAVAADSDIAIYQQNQDSVGLDWSDNEDTLGRDGFVLLHKVEELRRSIHLGDVDSSTTLEQMDDIFERYPKTLAILMEQEIIPADKVNDLTPQESSEVNDIYTQLRKMQRHIIEQQGLKTVDLWNAAVKLVTVSRNLYILTRAGVPQAKKRAGLSICDVNLPETSMLRKAAAKSTLMPQDPPVKDSSSKTSSMQYLPDVHNGGQPWLEALDTAMRQHMLKTRLAPPTSQQYHTWQLEHSCRDSLDIDLPWVLPFKIWMQIIGYIMPKQDLQALSEQQHRAVYHWGMKRNTLETERQWVKLAKSYQIWQLLAAVRCLRYEEK